MQKHGSPIWALILLAAVFGCERVVEYDLPGAAPRLVLNALICEDSLLRFEVSLSASPGDGAKIQSLRDAKIVLFEDQTLVKDFKIDSMYASPSDFDGNPIANIAPTKLFFHQTISTTARSGHTFEVEARYGDMAAVNASTSIPRPIRAHTIPQPLNESIMVDGNPLDRLVVQIDDNGNSQNYYGLEILAYKPGSGEAAQKIEFFSNEKVFAENLVVASGQHSQGVYYRPENGVYFSNAKFKGRNEQFDVYVDPVYLGSQYQLQLRVLTLSKDYFDFAVSYQKQKQNANNPFAEPTQVYNNIEGGLGIFAGYSVTKVDF